MSVLFLMWDDGQGPRHNDSTNMSVHIPRQIGCRNSVFFNDETS